MLWIKEVEMVDSFGTIFSPRDRLLEKKFPNFETLDAKIASALNKIIHKFPLQEEGQSPGAESPERRVGFLRGRQIAFMIYDYFRVIGAHDAVLDYADFFSVTLRVDNNVQEFDTRWDEVLLSMSKIPSDDVLESLYELRIRQSAQLKIVSELYDMESSSEDIDAQ